MRDGHLAADTIDHERLRIFERARSGGGITGVTDGAGSLKLPALPGRKPATPVPCPCAGERCAGTVARDDAGAFLAAMLQREQAVIGQHGRVRMTEDAEKPHSCCGYVRVGIGSPSQFGVIT